MNVAKKMFSEEEFYSVHAFQNHLGFNSHLLSLEIVEKCLCFLLHTLFEVALVQITEIILF